MAGEECRMKVQRAREEGVWRGVKVPLGLVVTEVMGIEVEKVRAW